MASTAASVTSCRVTLCSEVVVKRDTFEKRPETEVESKDMYSKGYPGLTDANC